MPEPKINPPTEAHLRFILSQAKDNPMMAEICQKKIDQHFLPCRIEKLADGSFDLKNIFSQGEEYLNRFITANPAMLSMKERAKKMALTDYPVLITGETGTGKEIIAKSMIGARTGLIQCVNCAGLPDDLVESEMFGHVKGAFTGAFADKVGLMESARDGVCYLDEIGDLPMKSQAALLRALQEMKVRPVGSNKAVSINCKFVFATNKDIKSMTKGFPPSFRLDLYARISTLELHLTPLTERTGDCIEIVKSMQGGEKFLAKYQDKLMTGGFDLGLNVRSLEQYVIRNNVLGEV